MAWDPWRNGKLKIFGFVGRFSGALPTNEAVIAFASISNFFSYNFDPISVVHDPNVGRARRGSSGTATTLVDEGIENWYQDELTLGVERALAPTTTIGLKGTYRRLGRALDDRCDLDYNHPDSDGSECAMYNPGSGGQFARGDMPVCDTLYDAPEGNQCFATGPAAPAARRLYRGIELLLRQSVSGKLWVQASYVYSSLRGNYEGGITASLPALWHNGYGTLSLDRPNRFRLDGWWKTPLPLTVGLQGFVESGAPLNKLGWHSLAGPTIFLVPRGSAGRLPTLWEANLTLAYPISVGPMTVTLQGYVHNLFNNQIVTGRDEAWSNSPPAGWAATIFDPNQEQTNPNYGKVTARSAPRSFRAAMRVSF